MACTLEADNAFGPAVGHGCRDGFDFTLLFEQSFFQLAPCALLLLLVPYRASQLRHQSVKVLRNGMQPLKQSAIAILAATQLAQLILMSVSSPIYRTDASIPAAVVCFLASLALLYLSGIEHTRSIRPSSLINVYVFFSLLLDTPQARTLWLRPGSRAMPALFTAGLAAKTVVLCLEAASKRRVLFPQYKLYAPEALVSLYDRAALWWINPLFWLGFRNFLSTDDLFPVDDDLSAEKLDAVFQREWARQPKTRKWAIFWSIFQSVKGTLLAMVFPRLCLSALTLCQPLLINRVTSLLSEGIRGENVNYGRGLIGAAALVYTGIAITTALYQRAMHRMVTKIRGIVVTAVYSKALALDYSKISDDNPALTLVTADINRVCMSLKEIDDLFATPLEIAVAMYLLERQIGVACIAPIAVTLVVTAVSFHNVSTAVPMQKAWLKAVSNRVAFTSSVLGVPKCFKMLGLTKFFTDIIQGMRVAELAWYARYRKFVTLRNVFSATPGELAPPFTLMMFTLIKGERALDATTAFTALALVQLLSLPISKMIFTVPMLLTALASLERVQSFLLLEENTGDAARSLPGATDTAIPSVEAESDAVELNVLASAKSLPNDEQSLVRIEHGQVKLGTEDKQVLNDICIRLSRGDIHLLVGPVGSGKSTLLRTIIGDVALSTGNRHVAPGLFRFAFCAQDPWLPNDTVQNLIIGKSDLDQQWYATVVIACALRPDIATFENGDDTLVGTKGVSLSGGQRQRIALARALYARERILVADDVLNGLDASTSRQVFNQVFGPRGICKAHGMTVLLATHSQRFFAEADFIIALGKGGSVVEQGSFRTLNAAGGYVHAMGITQASTSSDDGSDDVAPVEATRMSAPDKVELAQQDLARQTGDRSLYKYYLKSFGPTIVTVFVVSSFVYAFGKTFPGVWVKFWTEAESSNNPRPLGMWLGVSFLIAFISLSGCGLQIWSILVWAIPRSSAQLHKQILDALMSATYSFFVNTDSGVTLNRFSNDMSLIETALAGAVMQFTAAIGILVAEAAIIVSGASYSAAVLPVVFFVLYGIQKFYLRTSRQLRYLELETQAPLLTHVAESTAGVTTIRAFGWQHASRARCVHLLDRSQRAYYLMMCIQRWLTLVLGLLGAAIAIIVVSLALSLPQTTSAGALGVSLLNILGFTGNMTYCVEAWTALETSLGAVARCKNFEATTPSEHQPGEEAIPQDPAWPAHGALEVKNLKASYTPGGALVLDNVSLSICAGEKVAIVGRSGSGKSSFLLTLFRLLDPSSGTMSLDGIDLATLPRQYLRSRLCALPQETLTFPSTVWKNVDPLQTSTQDEACAALEKVGLERLTPHLESDLTPLGLSAGETQLFGLARLILSKRDKGKVVVLDEMSSALDVESEKRVVSVVNEEFKDCTVLAVVHRVKTLVDGSFDRIVVMDAGKVVEIGEPEALRRKEGGLFRGLWERS